MGITDERILLLSPDLILCCMLTTLSFWRKDLTPQPPTFSSGQPAGVGKSDFDVTWIWMDVAPLWRQLMCARKQERGTAPPRWRWRLWSPAPCPPSPSWRKLRSWRSSGTTSWCSSTPWCPRSPSTSSQSTWAKVDERQHMHEVALNYTKESRAETWTSRPQLNTSQLVQLNLYLFFHNPPMVHSR